MSDRLPNTVLELRSVRAGHGARAVLHGVDLQVARGEWVVLLGANGSGKSTLLDACVGRLAAREGDIRVAGHAMASDAIAAKRALGHAVVPERLPPLLTARECLAVQAAAKQLAQVDADVLALAEELRLSPWLDDAVALMSYGTRQKVGALVALLGDPALVVLDETFNGLDPDSGLRLKRHLRARVEARRCGVLLATHALDIAEHWADRVVLLHEGRLVHEWSRAQLDRLRDARDGGLEAALAARIAPSE